MNMSKLLLAIAAIFIGFSAMGQDVVYVDASVFPVYGKISEETNERYERLPARLEGIAERRCGHEDVIHPDYISVSDPTRLQSMQNGNLSSTTPTTT